MSEKPKELYELSGEELAAKLCSRRYVGKWMVLCKRARRYLRSDHTESVHSHEQVIWFLTKQFFIDCRAMHPDPAHESRQRLAPAYTAIGDAINHAFSGLPLFGSLFSGSLDSAKTVLLNWPAVVSMPMAAPFFVTGGDVSATHQPVKIASVAVTVRGFMDPSSLDVRINDVPMIRRGAVQLTTSN